MLPFPDWHRAGEPPFSASQVAGLQTYTTMPSLKYKAYLFLPLKAYFQE
jgi:hypothetical protein